MANYKAVSWRMFAVALPILFHLHQFTVSALQQQHLQVNARRGAKQMKKILGQNHYQVLSPRELRELAEKNLIQTPGSNQYCKKWRYWSELSITAIRHHLSENLPYPYDPERFEQLFYALGTAADRGEMPSFADPGSRSGYALEFFCRARLLADLLFNKFNQTLPEFWEQAFCEKIYFGDGQVGSAKVLGEPLKTCRVTSLGGGPGYDHLSIILADTYRNSGHSKTRIETTVFDYEEGWGDLVDAMNIATNKAMDNNCQNSLQWGGECDIIKPLSDPVNAVCQAKVSTTDIFICQYTVAENAKPLREAEFVFFSDLFDAANDKTIFIFTETTPRVWPEFADLLIQKFDGGNGFQIGFPRNTRRGKTGPQLVIQKREGATLSKDELSKCEKYCHFQTIHEEKIKNGYRRQSRKTKGSKGIVQPLGG